MNSDFLVYIKYFERHLDDVLTKFNVSYADLADYLGVTRQTVYNWAKKKVKINKLAVIGILYFFENEKGVVIFVDSLKEENK